MTEWPSFEKLSELAKSDPDHLEQLRVSHVEAIIEAAPKEFQQRLRGLQFQIDCTRRLHKSPVGACVEISRMMLDSLHKLNKSLNGGFETDKAHEATEQPQANILSFPAAG